MVSQEGSRFSEEEIASMDEFMAAQVAIYSGRYDQAIPMLVELHKKDRKNGMVVFELAKAYEATEDYSSADKYGAMAVRLLPDNLWAKLYYGKLMIKMEKYSDGADVFQQLAKIDSKDESHFDNYIKCLINADEGKKAMDEVKVWLAENPINERISRIQYDYWMQQGKEKEAEKALEMLSDQYPTEVRYLNNLASFYVNQDHKEKALKIFEKILALDPNHPEANAAMIALAPTKEADGPFLRTLLPIIERQDVDINIKIKELIPFVEKYAENQSEDLGGALLTLTETLTLIHPDDAKSFSIRGDVLYINNNKPEAIQSYQKTLELDDTNYLVWIQLMQVLDEENQLKDLSIIALNAIDLFPNQGASYYYYGLAENAQGNTSNALDYLNEGIFIAGRDQKIINDIQSEMARSYIIEGNLAQANSTIDKALTVSKEMNPNALEVKGDLLAAEGKLADAVEYWKKAQDLGSTRKSLQIKLNQ